MSGSLTSGGHGTGWTGLRARVDWEREEIWTCKVEVGLRPGPTAYEMSNSLGADKLEVRRSGRSNNRYWRQAGRQGRLMDRGTEGQRQTDTDRQKGKTQRWMLMRDSAAFPTEWELAGWCWLIAVNCDCDCDWNWRQRSGSRSSRKERCLARAYGATSSWPTTGLTGQTRAGHSAHQLGRDLAASSRWHT